MASNNGFAVLKIFYPKRSEKDPEESDGPVAPVESQIEVKELATPLQSALKYSTASPGPESDPKDLKESKQTPRTYKDVLVDAQSTQLATEQPSTAAVALGLPATEDLQRALNPNNVEVTDQNPTSSPAETPPAAKPALSRGQKKKAAKRAAKEAKEASKGQDERVSASAANMVSEESIKPSSSDDESDRDPDYLFGRQFENLHEWELAAKSRPRDQSFLIKESTEANSPITLVAAKNFYMTLEIWREEPLLSNGAYAGPLPEDWNSEMCDKWRTTTTNLFYKKAKIHVLKAQYPDKYAQLKRIRSNCQYHKDDLLKQCDCDESEMRGNGHWIELPTGHPRTRGSYLFGYGAHLKHSCDPNVQCLITEKGLGIFVALQDIKKGDELTFSWLSGGLEYKDRTNKLKAMGLRCSCKFCHSKEATPDLQVDKQPVFTFIHSLAPDVVPLNPMTDVDRKLEDKVDWWLCKVCAELEGLQCDYNEDIINIFHKHKHYPGLYDTKPRYLKSARKIKYRPVSPERKRLVIDVMREKEPMFDIYAPHFRRDIEYYVNFNCFPPILKEFVEEMMKDEGVKVLVEGMDRIARKWHEEVGVEFAEILERLEQ